MKFSGNTLPIWVLLIICCGLDRGATRAEPIQFTIDRTPSPLTISGTFSGFAIQEQSPGSMVTTYTGTIEADVTDASIAFLGGSLVAARTNGNWEPAAGGAAGKAPADYGGQVANLLVNGKAAMREVVFDAGSDDLPVSNGSFSSQGVRFTFVPSPASVVDYTYSTLGGGGGSGNQALYGTATNANSTNATLVTQGSELVLTIPVDISGSLTVSSPNDLQYRFRGRLVGRAPLPVPLQITAFQLASGALKFTIATTPGHSYTILGSTNLMDWPAIVDQFTATNTPTQRTVPLAAPLPQQYFRVRRD